MNIEQLKFKYEYLYQCMNELAASLKCAPLEIVRSKSLSEHILFNGEYEGISGKNSWDAHENSIITKLELCNLFMAHCATKIANFNHAPEPNCESYLTKELYAKFESALFSEGVKVTKS